MASSISRADFDTLVRDALDGLPGWLQPYLDGVSVQVEDAPPDSEPDLYGLYDGIPLGEDSVGSLPPVISVYHSTLAADFGHDPAMLAHEVRITVAHELAHHFGFDERRLGELGYG